MKFKYRGAEYSYEPQHLETIEESQAMQYRGAAYHRSRTVELPIPQPVSVLQYRGTMYKTSATGGIENLSGAEQMKLRAKASARPVMKPMPVAARNSQALQVTNSAHRQTILNYLQHRMQVAQAKGDQVLISQLQQEMQLLS